MDFNQHYQNHQDKTRVLIINDNDELTNIILSTSQINGKEIDFLLNNGENNRNNSDFFILETKEISGAENFNPNIVGIFSANFQVDASHLLKNIKGGGILIYNESDTSLITEIEQCENYFRKIPYQLTDSNKKSINTEIGEIPLNLNANTIEHIEGVKLLCQHLGFLEEDFYEAIVN